ncbi:g-patch domain-containing protein [Caerostris extrusa]|uniref:G-patch domain-containing protein n=1 Tax=Caerostris extrusa TaxID=172846 RepID=A0AAV4UZW8_CAEEX|nr:g-patch domain-containing protein [Caerostris extrusa]
MDEFARDLNTALEESSDRRMHESKVRRNKTWKCRARRKSKSGLGLGNSMQKSSAKSEDSESSLETWTHGQMDFSSNGSYHHTDSDDRSYKINHHDHLLTSWRHYSANVAESDSVNENLNPSREPRRKRKFKRMAVDPPLVAENKYATLSDGTVLPQKSKSMHNLKSSKFSKLSIKPSKFSKLTVSRFSSKMENLCMDFGNAATPSGKRKRAHEKSIECSSCDCKGVIIGKKNFDSVKTSSNPFLHVENSNSKLFDINSSGLSSSESECGPFTNDESIEADDEQSDFFQEFESSGIQNFSPWWENDDKQFPDSKIQKRLTENFFDISKTPKQVEKSENERQIRAGRRRLGNKISTEACEKEKLSYLPSSKEYKCFPPSSVDNCIAKSVPNEKKKRKGMPSSMSSMHGFSETSTVPDLNADVPVLKNMDWRTCAGLCRPEDAILSSIKINK